MILFDDFSRDDPEYLAEQVFSSDDPKKSAIEKARIKLGGRTAQTGPRSTKTIGKEDSFAANVAAQFRDALFSPKADIASIAQRVVSSSPRTLFLDVQVRSSARTDSGYRRANDLVLKFPWRSMPIDSRTIRSVLIFHYEGAVSPDSFGSGFPGTSSDAVSSDGYLVPATKENLRFVGFADLVEDDHDGSGDFVTMKARDLRSLLIDAKVPKGTRKVIVPGQTILQTIRAILDSHPAGLLIRGPVLEEGTSLLEVSDADVPRTWVPPSFLKEAPASGKDKPSGAVPQSKSGGESIWDAITDLVVFNGKHPRMDLDTLVIFEPRSLVKKSASDVDAGGQRIRQLVYGENLSKMKFARKLGKIRAPVVIAKSSNPDAEKASERLLSAQWPPKGPRKVATNVDATGAVATQEEHVVTVRGCASKERLEAVARTTYESFAHQELRVSVATSDVSSYDPGRRDQSDDPDLLSLRSGDPVQIIVAAKSSTGELGVFRMADVSKLIESGSGDPVETLIYQGFVPKIAERLVRILSSYRPPKEFRVNSVTVSYDADSGFQISIDARDYIRVRADPTDSAFAGAVKR